MTNKTQKIDGVINITTQIDPEESLDHIMNLPPEARKWALKYHFVKFEFGLHKLMDTLENLSDILFRNQMEIPPATRDRSAKIKEKLLQGKPLEQIALELGLSLRQLNYDLEYLDIHLRKERKKK